MEIVKKQLSRFYPRPHSAPIDTSWLKERWDGVQSLAANHHLCHRLVAAREIDIQWGEGIDQEARLAMPLTCEHYRHLVKKWLRKWLEERVYSIESHEIVVRRVEPLTVDSSLSWTWNGVNDTVLIPKQEATRQQRIWQHPLHMPPPSYVQILNPLLDWCQRLDRSKIHEICDWMDPHRWWSLYPLIHARHAGTKTWLHKALGSHAIHWLSPLWLTMDEWVWLVTISSQSRPTHHPIDSLLSQLFSTTIPTRSQQQHQQLPKWLLDDQSCKRFLSARLYFETDLELTACIESHPDLQTWMWFVPAWFSLENMGWSRGCEWGQFLVRHLNADIWRPSRNEWIPLEWMETCRRHATASVIERWQTLGTSLRMRLIQTLAPSMPHDWFDHACSYLFTENVGSLCALHRLRISFMLNRLPVLPHNVAKQRQVVIDFIVTQPEHANLLVLFAEKCHRMKLDESTENDKEIILATEVNDSDEANALPPLEQKVDTHKLQAMCTIIEKWMSEERFEKQRQKEATRLQEEKRLAMLEADRRAAQIKAEQLRSAQRKQDEALAQRLASMLQPPEFELQMSPQPPAHKEMMRRPILMTPLSIRIDVSTHAASTLSSDQKYETKYKETLPQVPKRANGFELETDTAQVDDEFSISSPHPTDLVLHSPISKNVAVLWSPQALVSTYQAHPHSWADMHLPTDAFEFTL